MGRQEFSGTVIVQQSSTLAGSGVYGSILVGTVAVEMKVGASALVNRSIINIQAAAGNSGIVYLGIDNTVTSGKYIVALNAGQTFNIEVEPTKTLKIWAIASVAGQNVSLFEGAN